MAKTAATESDEAVAKKLQEAEGYDAVAVQAQRESDEEYARYVPAGGRVTLAAYGQVQGPRVATRTLCALTGRATTTRQSTLYH